MEQDLRYSITVENLQHIQIFYAINNIHTLLFHGYKQLSEV